MSLTLVSGLGMAMVAGGIGLVDEWLENRGFVLTDANTEILANR